MAKLKAYNSSFEMLTDDPTEAYIYQMRSDLMDAVMDLIKQHGLTQKQAAELLAVTQPRISDLFKGKINKFSVTMLLSMLHKFGHEFKFNNAINKPSLTFDVVS